jgi:hypothetical protein
MKLTQIELRTKFQNEKEKLKIPIAHIQQRQIVSGFVGNLLNIKSPPSEVPPKSQTLLGVFL